MRTFLLAAVAAVGFLVTPAVAGDSLGVYGGWEVTHYTMNDGSHVCDAGMTLARHSSAATSGRLSLTSTTDGGAWVIVSISDWQVVDGRDYGRAIITIDNVSFYAHAVGTLTNAVSLDVSRADGAAFWGAFQNGRTFRVTFPNDDLSVSLSGSRDAFQMMQACYLTYAGGKRDPFSGVPVRSGDGKRNPFTSL